MNKTVKFFLSAGIVIALVGAYFWFRRPQFLSNGGRDAQVLRWIRGGGDVPEWSVEANTRCGNAPFQMPTSGLIGYLWGDSFRPGHRHQGIDIFGVPTVGVTPVYAAYDGFLTRKTDWKSTIAIRIPSDPLQPGRQIWTYYTHLADANGNSIIAADFPPGTVEVPVKAGTPARLSGQLLRYARSARGACTFISPSCWMTAAASCSTNSKLPTPSIPRPISTST